MKTALCAIAKNENHYVKEWVEHHLMVGFDKIYIVDNNDVDGENLEDVIGYYVKVGAVDIIPMRGQRRKAQTLAYDWMYRTLGSSYDWLAFFDIDEFLELETELPTLLADERYIGYPILRICWKTYTDNGYTEVYNDNYSSRRFTEVVDDSIDHVGYNFSDIFCRPNLNCKMFIRGGLGSVSFASAHTLNNANLAACNVRGEKVPNHNRFIGTEPIWEIAWLNHYRMKTISEWLAKIDRGSAMGRDKYADAEVFFRFNEWTPEKQRILDTWKATR